MKIIRPSPPEHWTGFVPSPELLIWVEQTILTPGGALHNSDHAHLVDADLAFLWAPGAFEKGGRTVLGQAEQVMFGAGGWQKARREQQMVEWFGRVPEFFITLAADYCATCRGRRQGAGRAAAGHCPCAAGLPGPAALVPRDYRAGVAK